MWQFVKGTNFVGTQIKVEVWKEVKQQQEFLAERKRCRRGINGEDERGYRVLSA